MQLYEKIEALRVGELPDRPQWLEIILFLCPILRLHDQKSEPPDSFFRYSIGEMPSDLRKLWEK